MITKTDAANINADLTAAVDAVLLKHGFARANGQRLRYGADDIKVSFEAARVGVDIRGNNFERYAFRFGLPADGLGKLFISRGEVFEVTGLEPKNRRYPLLARKHSDGKTFKFPIEDRVVDQLRNPVPELAR